MLSVSYLLHFHSTPEPHPFLRPTPLVYLLIALTLAEVFALQFIDTFKLRIRLIVTACFSIGGQSALLYLLFKATNSDLDPLALNALLPALRHLTRLSELFFFTVSLITIAIHALAQLVVDHRITADIFGRSSRLPGWNDDFSLAVILYGAACLETTHASGLSNEVALVTAKPEEPYIELGRLAPALEQQDASIHSNMRFSASALGGLNTEIKDVRPTDRLAGQAPDDMSRTSSLVREGGRFALALLQVILDLVRLGGLAVGKRCSPLASRARGPGRLARALRFFGIRHPSDLRRAARRTQHVVQMPLEESDPEDMDFEDAGGDDDQSDETDSDASAHEEQGNLDREDSFTLYTDFIDEQHHQSHQGTESQQQEELNQVMLAHLTSQRLTRSQFQQLAGRHVSPTALQRFRTISSPSSTGMEAHRSDNLETQLVCIVCRTEARSM